MPTNTTKTNSTEKKTTTPKTSNSEAIRIKELEDMIKKLSNTIKEMQCGSIGNISDNEEKDISPNKKTKLTSLTYGYFSLYAPNRGFLKFPKYGSSHTVTYAQLIDYVNACRTSTENGNFYIHNQDMVEDLGLSEVYETLLSDKIIDKILYSEDLEVLDILSNASNVQKNNICNLVCQKVYDKELTDMNKIDEISKALEVDILKKVSEMKDTSEFLSKN